MKIFKRRGTLPRSIKYNGMIHVLSKHKTRDCIVRVHLLSRMLESNKDTSGNCYKPMVYYYRPLKEY